MKQLLFLLPATALLLGLTVREKYFTKSAAVEYVCMPCGSSCDEKVHDKPGTCNDCKMELVDKSLVRFNKITPEELCSYIQHTGSEKVLLLDVRTKEEFEGRANDKFGRLEGAINIPVQELPQRMNELKKYRNKAIIVYCSHSRRSPRASFLLMQNGFTNVTNMTAGMSEWKHAVVPNDCNKKLYVPQ